MPQVENRKLRATDPRMVIVFYVGDMALGVSQRTPGEICLSNGDGEAARLPVAVVEEALQQLMEKEF